MNLCRIVVVGTSGSGKTTFAKKLAEAWDIPFQDLDDLFWLPGWQQRPKEEFTSLVEEVAEKPSWAVCGNQSKLRQLIWPKAQMIIWLDLPIYTCLFRVFKRSLRLYLSGESYCNGNRETLGRLFGPQSILWRVFSSYGRRKRCFTKEFCEQEKASSTAYIRLRSPKEVDAFLLTLLQKSPLPSSSSRGMIEPFSSSNR